MNKPIETNHLTEAERVLILELLNQVSIKATQPNAVEMAQICKGLIDKLGNPAPIAVNSAT